MKAVSADDILAGIKVPRVADDPIVRELMARCAELGLSQHDVAAALGTSQAVVSYWKTHGGITLYNLRRLCDFLGYELELRAVR